MIIHREMAALALLAVSCTTSTPPSTVVDAASPAGQALRRATEALIQRAAAVGDALPIMRG